MVSYYNHPFAMYQKNHGGGGNLPYSASPSAWYSASNYHHQPPNAAQFLDTDAPPQHMYHYPPHMLPPQPSPDWVGHDNYTSSSQNGSLSLQNPPGIGGAGGPGAAAFLSLNQATQNGPNSADHINDGIPNLPSPPATVHSGSDMSSPGATHGPSSSPHNSSRPTPVKSPYEWMKKPSYQSQPNPGKTRTKDKYRVVYTDHQRLELEKEFHYTRYITIRRKAELSQNLGLSERQVKIWFQNRRAKSRKQKKKLETVTSTSISMETQAIMSQAHMTSTSLANATNLSSLLDVKPKLEQSLHLQHLHQMSAMGMGMTQMGLHHHHHHPALHSHLPPLSTSVANSQSSPSPTMLMN